VSITDDTDLLTFAADLDLPLLDKEKVLQIMARTQVITIGCTSNLSLIWRGIYVPKKKKIQ
jgi:hypothetical protein